MQSTSPIWKWLWNEGGKNLPSSEYEGDIVSFDNPGYTYPKDITIGIEPVQSGSGDPSPTNVRPISGWTGAKVTRTGKNLFDDDANTTFEFLLPAGTYYAKRFRIGDSSTEVNSRFEILIDNVWTLVTRTSLDNGNITLTGDLGWGVSPEQTISLQKSYKLRMQLSMINGYRGKANVVLACESMPTEYVPYDGSTYSITFPSEAGTVYGGTLDVTTGLLTVTHGNIASYNGESLPGKWISSMDVYSAGGTPTTGAQVVYELATPQTYQLTPTEVKLLLGENNVWADTGDMTVALVSAGYTRLEARAVIAGTAYTEISAPVIVRAAMPDALSIGNVAAASLSLVIRGAGSIPRSAAVEIETRLNDGVTASEWLPQGTFYISRRARDPVTGALALECYDGLLKANAIWTPSAGSWPRTMGQVLSELAGLLGLALDSRTVVPSGVAFMLSEPEPGTTIRDALGMIAQAGGGSFVVTPGNKLRLVPLADVSGAAGAAGDAVDVDGVTGGIEVGGAATVTGLRDSWAGTTTLTGDDTGIVVDAALAPMIAVEVAGALIGRRYQPYSLSGAVCDPAAELGDFVRAGANGEVASALYSQRLTLGPAPRCELAAPGGGEVTDEYPYIGAATKTLALAKAYAREIAADAVAGLDDALTQREIFNRLTDDGAAQGLVLYNGQLYVNASYINAGALNARFINFNAPVDDFSVPDENDPDSLLEGQRVVNGWIVNTSGSGAITALECEYAKLLRGRTVTLTFAYNGGLDYCEAFWASFDGDEGSKVTQPVSPSNPYTYTFTVPDEAEWFSIAFTCSGIRQIRASVSGSAIVYPDDIQFTYAGLEIGRFTVDRSGNVRAGGWNLFRGATRFIGKVDMDSPLLIGSGGTGARSADGARTNLDVPSRTGAGASGTWGISVSGSAGSVAWGNVSGKPANYPGGCTGNAATATGVKDAGSSSRTLTIRYQGAGASATDWIPMYDSSGNLVPVSSTNLADKVRDKASGTWGISVTGNAANVTGTVAVGHGGTGATSAAGARSNLGLSATAVSITKNHWTDSGNVTRLFVYGGVLCVLHFSGYVNAAVEKKNAIMTIPSGYRPAYEVGTVVFNASTNGMAYWDVKSNGVLSSESDSANGHWFAGTLVWFIGK